MTTSLVAWPIVLPLLGALISYVAGRRATLVAMCVALATLCGTVGVVWRFSIEGPFRHAVGGWEPPLGVALRADGISVLMLAALAIGATAAASYAVIWCRAHPGTKRSFFPLLCLTWGALNALVLSADIFNMYVALELTTLGAVAMLGASGGRPALAAGLHYLLFSMAGSLAYLTGVVVLYGTNSVLDVELLGANLVAGPTAWIALGFMVTGLALKSALFPFHGWLPPAYASAPAPVAVVLSALVANSAFYVLLRVWLDVFPSIATAAPAQVLGALGAGGVVWGSVLAMRQDRLAKVLAYSSVSQIGYFFLLFPLGTRAALHGGLFLVISHLPAKAAMFMAVGTIRRAVGNDELARMQGLAQRLPLTFFTLALAGMSLIGMPPSGGFIGKWLITRAAFETGQWWWGVVALGGGLLTAGYVFRILRGAFLPSPEGVSLDEPVRSAQWLGLSLATMAVLLGLLPWLPMFLLNSGGTP